VDVAAEKLGGAVVQIPMTGAAFVAGDGLGGPCEGQKEDGKRGNRGE
jgi:hypothetical protein